MINPLSSSSPASALQTAQVGGVVRPSAVKATVSTRGEATQAPSPAADLAAAGPPVDVAKVARIKAGIADGSYTADPAAIASRMVDLDLGAAR